MDRLFVLDTTALPEYGSDGKLIQYICEKYTNRCLDRFVYTDNPSHEKTLIYRNREYRVIPITSVQKTEDYLKEVYGVRMSTIEIPEQLRKYRPDYQIQLGYEIPKQKANSQYFIKRLDKMKSWNSLLYDGDVSKYIKPNAVYSISLRHNILSEWRVLVHKNKIIACQNYAGDPIEFPDPEIIREMINAYDKHNPLAYTMDVAVTGNVGEKIKTIPIEVHAFVACGLYGFEDKEILDMWDDGLQWYIDQATDTD